MKLRIFIKLLFVLFLNTSLLAQENTNELVAKLNEDLDFFQEVIEKTHPIIYKYVEKSELDSIFLACRFDGTQELSNIALEKRVRHILSKIACVHTNISKSRRNTDKVFPLVFYAEGKDIFIIRDLDSLLDLSQPLKLLDINENSSETIVSKMLDYKSSDGYNTTLKYQLINSPKWFNIMYGFYFDADTIKNIRFVNANHDTLQITRKLKKLKSNKSVSKNDYDSKYGDNVTVKYHNDSIAVLRIKSFSGSPIVGSMLNTSRYKKALKEIEQKKVKNLIVDLRDNTGGNAIAGYRFVARFINEKHRVNMQYHGGGIFKYAVVWSKLKLVLNVFFGHLFSGRVPTFREQRSYINVNPKDRIYTGKVYVLVNGLTLSTASNVASFFKHKSDAVVMGEETGGGENILNAYLFPKVQLPNSGIQIQIPQYRIDLGLTTIEGSGVVPDIKIDSRLRYTEDGDGVLNKALELVAAERKAL